MTTTDHRSGDRPTTSPSDSPRHGTGNERRTDLARLGAWAGSHLRAVLVLWLLVLAVFGAFAPKVESALSGAGWQDSGSQSVAARAVIAKNFHGLGATALQVVVHDGASPIAKDPAAQQVVAKVEALLKADPRVSGRRPTAPRVRPCRGTVIRPSSKPEQPRTRTRWCAPRML